MSMIEEILQQMQGAPTQQVAGQLGVNDSQASQAIAAALPMLIGALGHNAQSGGAEALFGALGNHQQSMGNGGVGDLLGSVLGGLGQQQPSGSAINGAGILGHIFGGQQQTAAQQLGQTTGAGPRVSLTALTVISKTSTPRSIFTFAPARTTREGFGRSPSTDTLPVSIACLASARVLKKRAAQSQLSRRMVGGC